MLEKTTLSGPIGPPDGGDGTTDASIGLPDDPARQRRRAIAAKLMSTVVLTEERGSRRRIVAAEAGWPPVRIEGRWLRSEWLPDPARDRKVQDCTTMTLGNRMWQCGETGHVALRDVQNNSMLWMVPHTCNLPWCPSCARRRSGRRLRWAGPRYDALRPWTSRYVLLTLTQPNAFDPSRPTHTVTIEELDLGWYRGGETTVANGLTLHESRERWVRAFRKLRTHRRYRHLWDWDTGCLAYTYGIEATASCWYRNRRYPRWHTHGHLLCALGKDCGSSWGNDVIEAWCELMPGASALAQDAREVDPGGLAEVLKYAYKGADMTTLQVVEAVAASKGRRSHYSVGCLWPTAKPPDVIREALDAVPGIETHPAAPLQQILPNGVHVPLEARRLATMRAESPLRLMSDDLDGSPWDTTAGDVRAALRATSAAPAERWTADSWRSTRHDEHDLDDSRPVQDWDK